MAGIENATIQSLLQFFSASHFSWRIKLSIQIITIVEVYLKITKMVINQKRAYTKKKRNHLTVQECK